MIRNLVILFVLLGSWSELFVKSPCGC